MATKRNGRPKLTPARAKMAACVRRAIQHPGIGTKAELARRVNSKWQNVHEWAEGLRPVPPEKARLIDSATDGAVSKAEILPSVYG